MPVSPINKAGSFATFAVLSGGSPIPDTIRVSSIWVQSGINMPSVAQIVLFDGSPAERTFDISSSNLFVPGGHIAIEAGYYGNNQLVFKGNVNAQNIRINQTEASTLTVECSNPHEENRETDTNPVLVVGFGESILDFNASYSRKDGANKVYGTVNFQGANIAEPGKYLQLEGLGDRFNGVHLMSAVVHLIKDGVWTTEVTIGLPG